MSSAQKKSPPCESEEKQEISTTKSIPQELENSKVVSFHPVTITSETIQKLLLREKPETDALALYVAYAEIAQWQNTKRIKATASFMMERLGWGKKKLLKNKKLLIDEKLIASRDVRDAKGKVCGWFVEVFFVISRGSFSHPLDLATLWLKEPEVLDKKREVLNKKKQVLTSESSFNEILASYPRKENKAKARRIYESEKLEEYAPVISKHIEAMKLSSQWKASGGKFIPYLSTYLADKRWEEEVMPETLADKARRIRQAVEELGKQKNLDSAEKSLIARNRLSCELFGAYVEGNPNNAKIEAWESTKEYASIKNLIE